VTLHIQTDGPAIGSAVAFARELWKDAHPEILRLAKIHFAEIYHFKHLKLDVNVEGYSAMEEAGSLRVFSARSNGVLVGYATVLVNPSLHCKTSLQAVQDALFVHPEHRGFGRKFVAWCDEQLCAEGVEIVFQHVNAQHDFSSMLERLNYELVDKVYARRL
jgi:GNAT superfamily N-acetyltransferase